MSRFQFAFVKTAQMTAWERARFLGADHVKLADLSPDDILSMRDELRAAGMNPDQMYARALRNQPAGAAVPRAPTAARPKPPGQGMSWNALNAELSAPKGLLSPASTDLHLPQFDPHAPYEDLHGALLGSRAPRNQLSELDAIAAAPHAPAATPHAPAATPHAPAATPHVPAATPHVPAAAAAAAAPAARKSRAGLLGALAALGGTGAAAGTYAVRRSRQQAAAAAQKAKALADAAHQAQQLAARNRAMKHLGIGGAIGLGGLGLAHLFHSQDE